MNLQACEEYLTTLNFGITAEDISEYNEMFKSFCAMFRETGDIVVKQEYSDEEMLNYSKQVEIGMKNYGFHLMPKIEYLLEEGFIVRNSDGTIFKNNFNFKPLTEEDFCDIEE
jgi:hypothetical protein